MFSFHSALLLILGITYLHRTSCSPGKHLSPGSETQVLYSGNDHGGNDRNFAELLPSHSSVFLNLLPKYNVKVRVPRKTSGRKASAYCEKLVKGCPREQNATWWDLESAANVIARVNVSPWIAGGRAAAPTKHPYAALIGFGDKDDKKWLCGGTLISERYVMSAAHCTKSTTSGDAKWARLGDLDYSTTTEPSDPQEFSIVERLPHPEYREPVLYHDIALFRLDREAKFNNFVSPVCLHTSPTVPVTEVTATGWGRVGFVEEFSTWLVEVKLKMIEFSQCQKMRARSSRIPRGIDRRCMVCAGWSDGGKDTCEGDSGGPLLAELGGRCVLTQVGITSFGGICALPDSATVYTRVSNYIPWIESVVWP